MKPRATSVFGPFMASHGFAFLFFGSFIRSYRGLYREANMGLDFLVRSVKQHPAKNLTVFFIFHAF